MTAPRIGSLCSGYGGLDLAALDVFGGSVAWHCENDPHASAVLDAHWPGVPNHGDLTTVDWSLVEPVDVLTAGFPCQDLSYAGRGAGIQEGNRSGLWYQVVRAIGVLRPRLVLLENVDAIVGRRPGLDVVLTSLAELGFDADWCVIPASAVGAPHRRARWFCTAWPAQDADRATGGQRRVAAPGQAEGGRSRPDTGRRSGTPASGPPFVPSVVRGAPLGGHAPADAERDGHGGAENAGSVGRVDRADEGASRQRQRAREVTDSGGVAASADAWGAYTPAIRRWEHTIGRPAPAPTEPGRTGQPRLSPAFVEWMQGLPAGWVTGVPIGRNPQLKALGNGVVPQQAAAAYRALLGAALAGAA